VVLVDASHVNTTAVGENKDALPRPYLGVSRVFQGSARLTGAACDRGSHGWACQTRTCRGFWEKKFRGWRRLKTEDAEFHTLQGHH